MVMSVLSVLSHADDILKVDTGIKVYDYADLLNEQQEKKLSEKANEILKNHNIDIAIVTVNATNGKSSMEYADDFFDYNPFGYGEKASGILMLINMEEREVWISTHGDAIKIFTDSKIESLLDEVYLGLSQKNYYKTGNDFLSKSEFFISKWEMVQKPLREQIGVFGVFSSALFFGFGIGIFITFVLFISTKKNLSGKLHMGTYQEDFKVVSRIDEFLSTNTTRTIIPKAPPVQNFSSGSSGGSTTHSSSSGRTHGGGGRKF